jgi:hypothetical protein
MRSLAGIFEVPDGNDAAAAKSALAGNALANERHTMVIKENESVNTDHEPSTPYPGGVGRKFNTEGSVGPSPGNTIICHLPQASELSKSLLTLIETLRSSNLAHL